MKKITKKINKQFEHRHFIVRVISYSFYEALLGAEGTASVEITDLKNGDKGTVQALGNKFGSISMPPYISLDGDDRTGESAEGENLRIEGNQISNIKRVLVYTFIYDGVANWRDADAIVTITSKNSEDLIIKPDSFDSQYTMFAIALIENVNDEAFSIEKIAQYYRNHIELDRAFHWGLNWRPGRK